jgi:putative phage-type endonuclease
LNARQGGIGASEISSALGISPFGSPYELWLRKTGQLTETVDNAVMEWGRELESTILKRFLKGHPEFKSFAVITGRMFRSTSRVWQLASPDAVVFDSRKGFGMDHHRVPRTSEGYPVVVQIKTAHTSDGWGDEGSDQIPVYYRAQVQWEMDVVGAEVAWVPVLFRGRDYKEYRIRRDDADLKVLRARGQEFWNRVTEFDPPPVDGHKATTTALKQSRFDPESVASVPADLMLKIARYKRLIARSEHQLNHLENQLREAMGTAQAAYAGDIPVARRSTWMSRTVDVKTLREEHPDLIEKYTHEVRRSRLNLMTKELEARND